MTNQEKFEKLQKEIGYHYRDTKVMMTALSHSSYANEMKHGVHSNERLEFLGDAVLSVIVSDYLFRHYSHLEEGELTKLRASLVCEKALSGFAETIGLGECLLLGRGEEMTGGRKRPSIQADAFEAVIASIYLDGGLERAREFVLSFVKPQLEKDEKQKKVPFIDYKTMLQEIIQQNKEEVVSYKLVGETGQDHDKRFCVEVHLNSNVIGKGTGRSKKEAEQQAAKEALSLMGEPV